MGPRTKRIIAEVLLFNGILLGLLWGLNAWVDYKIDTHYELFYRELLQPKDFADVVILGTSKSVVCVNPRDLEAEGIKAVNFSTDNSDPVFYEKWYDELFLKFYKKPAVIVYCVDWVLFENKGRHFEHDSQYFPTAYFFGKLFDRDLNRETLIANRFALFKYRPFIFKLLKNQFSYEPWLMGEFYKGYVPVMGEGELKPVKVTGIDEIDPRFLAALHGLLNLWEKEGIKIVFAQSPDYIPGRTSEHFERNMQVLHHIAEERGIPFLDYNGDKVSPLNYEKRSFRDWTHLNKAGAERFSPIFARDLKILLRKRHWL